MAAKAKPIKPKQFKYIILVTTTIDNRYHALDGKELYVGFSNDKNQVISSFLTGVEINKNKALNGIVQLPEAFNSKKDALLHIKRHQKIDEGFNVNHKYQLVPVHINA
jgi:hypothetical protein